MKKLCFSWVLILLSITCVSAQTYKYEPYRTKVTPSKNVIVMIPDGTSMGVVTAARWYKIFNGLGSSLNIDPYFCGFVKTHSSNAPIGDSAPTTSCYMTGMPQQTGNVAIYPLKDEVNDLVEVDASMAYQPLATLLEAARIEQGKSTGLVVTCEFTHATPADCSAHHYNRGAYDCIAPQIVNQNLDVVFAGGSKLMNKELINHLNSKGINYIENDLASFQEVKGKSWALLNKMSLPYDLDRDETKFPSLREMTEKALSILSENPKGFFMMVEGSKVDWAAHANDAVGCITEFLAFDEAVGAVIDFAKKNKNTSVVILPDHGNSGFTIGRHDLDRYDRASLEKLFGAVSKYKMTSEGLGRLLLKEKQENIKQIVKEKTSLDLSANELNRILNAKNSPWIKSKKKRTKESVRQVLIDIMNKHTYFGFTSFGHTGEDVFLAAYHPNGEVPLGLNTNIEINHYLCDALGLKTTLPELTEQIFVKHTDVFVGSEITIVNLDSKEPTLVVRKGENEFKVKAFQSVAYLNDSPFNIGSVAVYIDKNKTFYLPRILADLLNN